MRLLEIESKNVFSIDHLCLDLANRGLVLVSGNNGSGKSSIANKSIVWGLYGSTSGGLVADDVIRRQSNKSEDSFVRVKFIGVDGKNYQITRSRRPKSQLELLSLDDGSNLTMKVQQDTQVVINNLLGKNIESFLQTDYMGQGREQNFLSLTPKAQKDILESILPIKYLSSWAARAKEEKQNLKKVLDTIEKRSKYAFGSLNQAIENRKLSLNNKDSWCETQVKKINITLEQIKGLEVQSKSLNEELTKLQEELQNLKSKCSEENINYIKNTIDRYKKRSQEYQLELDRITKLNNDWSTRLSVLNSKINKSKVPNLCPTCGQQFTKDKLEEHNRKQDEIKQNIVEAEVAVSNISDCLQLLNSDIKDNNSIIEKWQNELRNLESGVMKIYAIDKKISDTINRLHGLNLSNLQNKLELLYEEKNPFVDMVASIEKDINELEKNIENLDKKQNNLKNSLMRLNFWIDAFSNDFRFFMLAKACPFLNYRVSYHLNKLNSSHLHAEFSTTKELKSGDSKSEFSVNVYSDGGGKGFDSLSGGEQQALSFAVGLALADLAETQVGGSSSVMILDEPFIYLDSKNSENLVNYLIGIKKETILLISNDDYLKSLIPNIIGVKRNEAGCTSFVS